VIQYETIDSSFFYANKKYCETIESKFKTINLNCSGFCNCYGYDVETILNRDNLTYNIRYHKHQSTQNGFVMGVAVNAIDYAGVEVTVTGLNKKFSIIIGKSLLNRFFCSNKIKETIPEPYFIKSNKSTDNIFIYNLIENLLVNNISTIKLRNGTLICKLHIPTADPLKLISDIEKSIKVFK